MTFEIRNLQKLSFSIVVWNKCGYFFKAEFKMKSCTIHGDVMSEKSSENYPTVPVCDECVEESSAAGEDNNIVSTDDYDKSLGDTCEFCGKTLEEEQAE